jgi:hypothetical protein
MGRPWRTGPLPWLLSSLRFLYLRRLLLRQLLLHLFPMMGTLTMLWMTGPLRRPGRTPPRPPRPRRPLLGWLPLLWILLLLPPPPLLLQLSFTPSPTASLPLGQGGPSSAASSGSSVASSSPSAPPSQVSSLSSQPSSQRSARSRSPHSQRSASVNSRDSEADDFSGQAKGRPGRKRGLSGGKGSPAKAVKPRLPYGETTLPSQKIEQCASP